MNLDQYWNTVAHQAVKRGAQQKPREFAQLLAMVANHQPKVIVEIGVAQGATLWAWQHIAPCVIGIDTALQLHGGAVIITGDSHGEATFEALTDELSFHAIDLLFVDGDHSYKGVRADYEMYSPLVDTGGLIAFHDIASVSLNPGYELGVPKFWAEIRNDTAVEFIDTTPGSGGRWGDQWGGIGVLTA